MKIKRQFGKAGMVLLAAILSCSLISCGKEEPGLQIVSEQDPEPVYISFFAEKRFSDGELGKYWSDRFVELYNQQIYVNYEGASYYDDHGLSYRELLEKRLESSSPDDLYIINAEDVLEFEQKGYWMDLSDLDFVDNLSDAALYQSTYNGKVFSVPLVFSGFGFLWNVTMLKEYGLAVPENMAEFVTVCETLKSEGILPYGANKGYALTVPAMCVGLSGLYGSDDRDQRIRELNSGELPISSYMTEGFAFLEWMIEKGYMDPVQAMDAEPRKEDLQLFKEEGCAFICIDLGSFITSDSAMDAELTGLPLLSDGRVAVYGADKRLCVNPHTTKMDKVLKFIEMVGTQEALDESAQWQKKLSSAKDSRIPVAPFHRQMSEQLTRPGQIPNQDFSLHFSTWENIRDLGREICNGISAEEAGVRLDEIQRKELEQYAQKREKP